MRITNLLGVWKVRFLFDLRVVCLTMFYQIDFSDLKIATGVFSIDCKPEENFEFECIEIFFATANFDRRYKSVDKIYLLRTQFVILCQQW